MVKHFKNLLTASSKWRPSVNGFQFRQLERLQVAKLEKPFSEEEVFFALRSFDGDKAPLGWMVSKWPFGNFFRTSC